MMRKWYQLQDDLSLKGHSSLSFDLESTIQNLFKSKRWVSPHIAGIDVSHQYEAKLTENSGLLFGAGYNNSSPDGTFGWFSRFEDRAMYISSTHSQDDQKIDLQLRRVLDKSGYFLTFDCSKSTKHGLASSISLNRSVSAIPKLNITGGIDIKQHGPQSPYLPTGYSDWSQWKSAGSGIRAGFRYIPDPKSRSQVCFNGSITLNHVGSYLSFDISRHLSSWLVGHLTFQLGIGGFWLGSTTDSVLLKHPLDRVADESNHKDLLRIALDNAQSPSQERTSRTPDFRYPQSSFHSTLGYKFDGISLDLSYRHLGFDFSFPLKLTSSLNPLLFLLLVGGQYASTWLFRRIFMIPILKSIRLSEKLRSRAYHRRSISLARKRAQDDLKVMAKRIHSVKLQEESKSEGLVILHAFYGALIDTNEEVYVPEEWMNKEPSIPELYPIFDFDPDIDNITAWQNSLPEPGSPEDPIGGWIRVDDAITASISKSRLVLSAPNKADIPGFYDPCPGEDKQLLIRYLYKGAYHEVIVENHEALLIPQDSHRLE